MLVFYSLELQRRLVPFAPSSSYEYSYLFLLLSTHTLFCGTRYKSVQTDDVLPRRSVGVDRVFGVHDVYMIFPTTHSYCSTAAAATTVVVTASVRRTHVVVVVVVVKLLIFCMRDFVDVDRCLTYTTYYYTRTTTAQNRYE